MYHFIFRKYILHYIQVIMPKWPLGVSDAAASVDIFTRFLCSS